jgi:D-alanyl-D-alanine carboxypeptidase/D-alanyl-D-alanine-endopeptidase (penicillin-binding protein 4)
MKSKLFIAVILFSCGGFLFAQHPKNDTVPKYSYSTVSEFWEQLDDIFDDPNFNNSFWGVVIQSLVTGEYFYKNNEDKLLVPASNLKLFTTSSGLILLGPEYKYKTNIFTNGKVEGTSLIGDLIVQGRGDPTISGRFSDGNMFKTFEDWADSLAGRGIDEIRGNIIGDDNLFEDKGLGNGWEWDYESYWFAAPTGALSFNDNCVDMNIVPTEIGKPAKIILSPNTKYVILINNVRTVKNDSLTSIDFYRERGTNVITVNGTIKHNTESYKTYVTVNNPTQYFVVVLKDVLEKKGITVKGYPIDIDDLPEGIDYAKCGLLFSTSSPPLKDILKVINKNSQNFYAEQLLKTIGLEKGNYGSVENGLKFERNVLQEMGINPENTLIVDGSGLSHSNLVTAKQFVSLLNYMYKSRYFLPFYNSLPIAGVDGSLANRLKNTKAENRIRAKTGFIGNVRSLSGYAYTADNEPVAFAIIANNFLVPSKLADNIQDLVCLRLSNFKRK